MTPAAFFVHWSCPYWLAITPPIHGRQIICDDYFNKRAEAAEKKWERRKTWERWGNRKTRKRERRKGNEGNGAKGWRGVRGWREGRRERKWGREERRIERRRKRKGGGEEFVPLLSANWDPCFQSFSLNCPCSIGSTVGIKFDFYHGDKDEIP